MKISKIETRETFRQCLSLKSKMYGSVHRFAGTLPIPNDPVQTIHPAIPANFWDYFKNLSKSLNKNRVSQNQSIVIRAQFLLIILYVM